MDKNGKKPTGTIRQFFRRVSLLGILLAGGILIYSANREDLGLGGDSPAKKENSTMVQRPKTSSGLEATPHGMRVHRVAYSPSEEGGEGEATSEAVVETSSTPMEESMENSSEISDGVMEMPNVGDMQETEGDLGDTSLPSLPDVEAGPDWDAMPSAESEPIAETTPLVSSEPASGMDTTSPEENFPTTASPEVPSTSVQPPPSVASSPTSSVTDPAASPSPPNLPPLVKDGSHPLKNVAGPPVQNFLEVFDFNVDPDWVTSRWSYVTTVGPLNTRGYRVPLCTGIDKSDLVGNLTYYFNHKLEVEKITFEGYTGDLERLLITLRYFHMAKRVTADPNVILYESPTLANNYQSYMRSYHRTTPLDGETPHHRFWITMELYPEDED